MVEAMEDAITMNRPVGPKELDPLHLQEIKSAINALTISERESIAAWLQKLNDNAYRIGEPAVAYETTRDLLSVEEYLELEAASPIRHEYMHGVLHAMSGVSEQHNDISTNLVAAFHGHLRGGPCKPYVASFKVRLDVNRSDIFYYPDIMVACVREGVEKYFLRYPKLIVEVLSKSTEKIDQREKLLNYLQIPTLEEYVLVSQQTFEITSYRRLENWTQQLTVGPEAIMVFHSIGLSLPVTQVYEGVNLYS